MGVMQFVVQLLKEAPDKRLLLRSLAFGNRGGNREVASADGTSLSVRVGGTGPSVVLVHGTLDGIGAFSMVELPLQVRYQTWVYDRRGRGDSGDATVASFAREIDDLRAVIAATGHLPHVVAHSYGAVVALQARLRGGRDALPGGVRAAREHRCGAGGRRRGQSARPSTTGVRIRRSR